MLPDVSDTPSPADPGPVRCASCGKAPPPGDTKPCAICKRPVCLACLRPYGHHMLACEECRLEAW